MKSQLFLSINLLFILIACNEPIKNVSNYCIPPESNVFYDIGTMNNLPTYPTKKILPPSPWQIIEDLSDIPIKDINNLYVNAYSNSIWMISTPSYSLDRVIYNFYIFDIDSKTTKSFYLESTGTIGEVFFTGEDVLWVRNYYDSPRSFFDETGTLIVLPPLDLDDSSIILSKYSFSDNDDNLILQNEFNFESAQINISNNIRPNSRINIHLGKDETFWIIASYDGIYNYKPSTSEVDKVSDMEGLFQLDTTISQEDIIYLIGYYPAENNPIEKLFTFEKSSERFEEIVYKLEPWPKMSNLRTDRFNRLWFGGLGWMEPNGTWKQLVRQPIFVNYSNLQDPLIPKWQNPFMVLESSDGRYWFYSENGMSWLNLEEEQWCWFTTYQSNIVEDSDKNLWMIADNKLYKLPLGE